MIVDRTGYVFPDCSERGFQALHDRLQSKPARMTQAAGDSAFRAVDERRYDLWTSLLSDLIGDEDLQAALRVALSTKGNSND